MDQKFDKAERERIHNMLSNGFYPASLQNYIQALEDIAKTSAEFWQHIGNDYGLIPFDQLPLAEQKLMKSLDTVDWMRND